MPKAGQATGQHPIVSNIVSQKDSMLEKHLPYENVGEGQEEGERGFQP